MNILQINGADQRGGAHELAWSLQEGLRRLGCNTAMFVSKKYSSDSDVYVINTPIYRKLLARIFATDINFFSSDEILDTDVFKKADIVHCHNLHGSYFKLSTLKKISKLKPVVWTLHDEWAMTSHCPHSFGGKEVDGFYVCPTSRRMPFVKLKNEWYLLRQKRKVYEASNFTLVAPSLWLKNRIAGSFLKNKNSVLIYNGVNQNIFKKSDKINSRKELGLPLDKKIALFVSPGGQNNTWKGWNNIKTILSDKNALKSEDLLLVCLGGWESDRSVDEEFKEKVVKIPFVKDRNILAKYYSAADLLVFTSVAENFPLTVVEAMSCGLPVVSFDVGGVKEAVINGVNGYVAKYGDIEDIKKGMEIILGLGDEEYKTMSENCRQRVEKNFTLDIMTNKYLALYKKTIDEYV